VSSLNPMGWAFGLLPVVALVFNNRDFL